MRNADSRPPGSEPRLQIPPPAGSNARPLHCPKTPNVTHSRSTHEPVADDDPPKVAVISWADDRGTARTSLSATSTLLLVKSPPRPYCLTVTRSSPSDLVEGKPAFQHPYNSSPFKKISVSRDFAQLCSVTMCFNTHLQ